jgi:hypothetical protein
MWNEDPHEEIAMLILLSALAVASADPIATVKDKDDPIICTKAPVGSEVGTHLQSKKICMRKSDRDYIDREQRDTLRDIQNRGDSRMQAIPPPGPPRDRQ